ncbi:MAG TPA: FadR/GntR family transcriptional regulator [Candidatus Cybelea sp.]|nr:FadR/GntR family transcriptional regulator [Candidatus Cybelea sp.]
MRQLRTTSRVAAVRKSSLHHQVAQDIGARILKGEFAPGDLLPNEAESCRAYGVSRTAVREAMKMLTAKGLILSRPKIGSRVQPRDSWNLLDRDVLVWYCAAGERNHFLASMHQMREILEPEAAALAAINHSAEQLRSIEQALIGMRDAADLPAWNVADVRFHLAILLASGNELLVPFGFLIESALGTMFDFTGRHNQDWRKAYPLHEAIVVAIRKKRPEAARKAARLLLADTGRVLAQWARESNRGKRPAKVKARS